MAQRLYGNVSIVAADALPSGWAQPLGRSLHLQAGFACHHPLWQVTCKYAAISLSKDKWQKAFNKEWKGPEYILGQLVFYRTKYCRKKGSRGPVFQILHGSELVLWSRLRKKKRFTFHWSSWLFDRILSSWFIQPPGTIIPLYPKERGFFSLLTSILVILSFLGHGRILQGSFCCQFQGIDPPAN